MAYGVRSRIIPPPPNTITSATCTIATLLRTWRRCLRLGVTLLIFLLLVSGQDEPWPRRQVANYSADIMLGALFPIHEAHANYSECGRIQLEDGIQPLEALLYTVDKINREDILPGFRLGVMALDSCDNVIHALEQSLHFIKGVMSKFNEQPEKNFKCGDGTVPEYRASDFGRVVGVIGGQSSQVSIQIANLLRIFHIPQISYLSTSSTLSNKEMFGYFFRTVPSDINQVVTILEILKAFQWTYVSLVYSNTDYGNKGLEELEKLAPSYNVCFASPQRINVDQFVEADYNKVIQNLIKSSAKVVVMFADKRGAKHLISAAKRENATGRFEWIGSDGWSGRETVVQGQEAVIEGAISVQPMWGKLAGFDEYFAALRPSGLDFDSVATHSFNPWFDEFWEERNQCRLAHVDRTPYNADYEPCRPPNPATVYYRQPTYLHFVRDAAYAFAHALRDMHAHLCGATLGVCRQMKENMSGERLKQYLHNVTFKDELDKTFRFQKNGDGPPRYSILNYQKMSSDTYAWVVVGSYLMTDGKPQLAINRTVMKFHAGNDNHYASYCSEPCRQGQAKIKQEGESCCWVCTNCSTYQILPDEFHCRDCQPGTKPDLSKIRCEAIPEEYVDYGHPWAIAAMAIAGLGLLLTMGVALIFWVYSDTPFIKAAGRELSYILLLGIFMSYAVTLIVVAKPSTTFCGLTRFFSGLCYATCYSAIVTKTNRIARIFNTNSTPQKTRYISPRSQVLITVLLTSVEVMVNTAWLIARPPAAVNVYPTRDENVLICAGSDNASYLVGLIYPSVLLALSTLYAFKTRKCPDGFNETRFVAFTVYTTCVLWLAFVPLFFSSADHLKRTITLSFSLTLAASVQLACLFVPKVYLVLFRPEKNTKESVMSQHHRSGFYAASSNYVVASQHQQQNQQHTSSPTFLLSEGYHGDGEFQKIPRLDSTASSTIRCSTCEASQQQLRLDNSRDTVDGESPEIPSSPSAEFVLRNGNATGQTHDKVVQCLTL